MPHTGEFAPISSAGTAPPQAVAVGASPFIFTAPDRGVVLISGGTVTSVDYIRKGLAYGMAGAGGAVPVLGSDGVRVIYTVAPTIWFIKQ